MHCKQKKKGGRHYQLTAQVKQGTIVETYDVEIWHKVKKNAKGVVLKEQYILGKFVDSDEAWLSGTAEWRHGDARRQN